MSLRPQVATYSHVASPATDRTDRPDRTGHKQISEGIRSFGALFPRLTFFAEYVLRRFGKEKLGVFKCHFGNLTVPSAKKRKCGQ